MKILISNDDGINAKGIRTLAKRLAKEQENHIYVVAPDRERSATGHGLTLHKPLRVEEVHIDDHIKGSWATTGTPSDCVKFGMLCLLPEKPDLVVSGINAGQNMGIEVLYSGTVSAAMEGTMLGIPSIAVSLSERHGKHFEVAAEFIADLVKIMPREHLSKHVLLNVNVPDLQMSEIKGARITELGLRLYDDRFEKRVDPRGKVYYWQCGHALEEDEPENTDVWANKHKYISVTPITFNMTHKESMTKLSNDLAIESVCKKWQTTNINPKASTTNAIQT